MMRLSAPAGTDLFQKIELNRFAATARAYHSGCPEMFSLAAKVNGRRFQPIRNLIDTGKSKMLGLLFEPARPSPSGQEQKKIPALLKQ
jgi:hypothetical protein